VLKGKVFSRVVEGSAAGMFSASSRSSEFQGSIGSTHIIIKDTPCIHNHSRMLEFLLEDVVPPLYLLFLRLQDGLNSNKPSVKPQNFNEIMGTFLKIRQFPFLGLKFEAESEQLR